MTLALSIPALPVPAPAPLLDLGPARGTVDPAAPPPPDFAALLAGTAPPPARAPQPEAAATADPPVEDADDGDDPAPCALVLMLTLPPVVAAAPPPPGTDPAAVPGAATVGADPAPVADAPALGPGPVAMAGADPDPAAITEFAAVDSGAGPLTDAAPMAAGPLALATVDAPVRADTPPPPAPLAMHEADWPVELVQRLRADLPEAAPGIEHDLTLDLAPETLGPLRLHVSITEEGARVTLLSATPEAARLIQDSRPQLDQALAGAGFLLSGDGGGSRDQSRPAPQSPDTRPMGAPPALSVSAPARARALDLLA